MKFYMLLLLAVCTQLVNSQNCNSTYIGEVKDFHDGTSLYGATVFLKESNKYVSTDINGKFKFTKLCDGIITLVISHIGCETKEVKTTIKGDTFGTINLEHHSEELNEVTVHGKSGIKATSTAQESIIKNETLENYSSASLGDALKEVSGVSSINTGGAIVKPVINGLHSSRVAIINHGVRLQDQEWGIEHAPNVDINSVESVSLIKGSGALAFSSDAIGGIVVLNSHRIIRKDSLFGKTLLNYQTNGRGGNISTSLTKTFKQGWFVSGQGTYKQLGDFHAPDYSLTNTGVKTKAFSLDTGYKKFEYGFEVYYSFIDNTLGILSASHLGNRQDLINAINNPDPLLIEDFSYDINNPKQEVTHHLFKTKLYKRFESLGKLNLQFDYQVNNRLEFDRRRGENRDLQAVDLDLKTYSLLADFKFDANKDRVFNIGGLYRYQENFADPITKVRRLIPDYEKIDIGAFVTSNLRLNEKLLIDAGFRYDFNNINAAKWYQKSRWEERNYNLDFSDLVVIEQGTQVLTNPNFDYHNYSLSTGLNYSFNSKLNILFNYSLSNRAPNPSELFSDGLHHSASRFELGELRLQQETSNRISTTLGYKSEKLSINTDFYYNLINNFIYIEPSGVETTNRGEFTIWEYKQTKALLFGLDFSLDYELHKNWMFSNSTSYIKGQDKSNNRALIDMPSFTSINTLSFTKKEWLNFRSSLKSEWVAKQNDYPNNNFLAYIAFSDTYQEVDISSTPSAYHLFHFSSSIELDFKNKATIVFNAGINNLLNTSYRNNLNRLRYFSDDIGRNMIFQIKINY